MNLGNSDVARVIVNDTIVSAHTKIELNGDATVNECLQQLKSPEGELMIEAVMAEYLGAGAGTWRKGPFDGKETLDTRVFSANEKAKGVRVHAAGLRDECCKQLESYLALGPEQRTAFRMEIERAAASDGATVRSYGAHYSE